MRKFAASNDTRFPEEMRDNANDAVHDLRAGRRQVARTDGDR